MAGSVGVSHEKEGSRQAQDWPVWVMGALGCGVSPVVWPLPGDGQGGSGRSVRVR